MKRGMSELISNILQDLEKFIDIDTIPLYRIKLKSTSKNIL